MPDSGNVREAPRGREVHPGAPKQQQPQSTVLCSACVQSDSFFVSIEARRGNRTPNSATIIGKSTRFLNPMTSRAPGLQLDDGATCAQQTLAYYPTP